GPLQLLEGVTPMMNLSNACVWDCESDGLLPWQVKDGAPHVTRFHCAWIYDRDKKTYHGYGPDQEEEFLGHLATFDIRIGHNVMGYDEPLLEYLFGERWLKRR